MIGELVDHYRVLELIGRGAMGVVYKALDVNLDRTVALKVMSAEVRNDPDFVERFRQEARVQAALNHPNVALLFDYFIHDGAPVAVMEFIEGESLEQLIRRRGAIPAREAIPIFKQALRGVAAAHRAGIIHRDLKPANLMLTTDGVVKVMDFGIAKRPGVTGATKVSTSIGSPLYMAPEQILGRPVDCRTDVYGLGITLYELVSGYRPFNPRDKAEYLILNAHVNDVPEPPTVYRFGIPQPIVDAVMRSLAKEPEARFQSADEFAQALPDVPAPDAAAPDIPLASTVALASTAPAPRVGPTGTVALAPDAPAPRVGPTGTVALGSLPPMAAPPMTEASAATRKASGTVAIDYSPSMSADLGATRKPSGTVAIDYSPAMSGELTATHKASGTMAFEYSAGTVRQDLPPPRSGVTQRLGASRPVIVTALIATLVLVAALALGTHGRAERLRATGSDPGPSPAPLQAPTQASSAMPTPVPAETAAPPAAAVSPAAEAPAAASTNAAAAPAVPAVPAATAPPAAATPDAGPDLAGTWRGEYVDASGKQLLRVVSLSIGRVYNNGGVEGTLTYESASGSGECKLHPRGSTYWAGERRLQLSPEGCSLHYPKELGVPVNFNGVNPRANTLKNGRIEAPTGEVIRVRLKRAV
jgi:serine/threonine-protein kinase